MKAVVTMEQSELERQLTVDRQLCFAVYAAAHAFTRTYKPLLEPLGLTYPQYLVLMALWEKGEQPVKLIGEALDLDSGTLSPLLKRLQQAALIFRRRDARDERQVLISLTEKGAALKQEAIGVMTAIGAATGCNLQEMTELRDALNGVRHRMSAAQHKD
jgi:DNA-binding MarR family transcriptional regulator